MPALKRHWAFLSQVFPVGSHSSGNESNLGGYEVDYGVLNVALAMPLTAQITDQSVAHIAGPTATHLPLGGSVRNAVRIRGTSILTIAGVCVCEEQNGIDSRQENRPRQLTRRIVASIAITSEARIATTLEGISWSVLQTLGVSMTIVEEAAVICVDCEYNRLMEARVG